MARFHPAETDAGKDAACLEAADLLAGDALDSLDAADALALRRHLAVCADCRRERATLAEAAAALALAAPPAAPPDALRQRVMAAVATTPQERRARPPLALVSGAARRVSPPWVAAAAACLVAGVSFFTLQDLQRQVATLNARAQRYDRVVGVLASRDLNTLHLAPAEGQAAGQGTVYLDPSSGTGMVMVHDLPPLRAGRTWQLWFVRGGERVSGGLVYADQRGTGYSIINVPRDLRSFEAIGITEEPSGGSPSPTTARVLGARL